jgi:hypothetical protein
MITEKAAKENVGSWARADQLRSSISVVVVFFFSFVFIRVGAS